MNEIVTRNEVLNDGRTMDIGQLGLKRVRSEQGT